MKTSTEIASIAAFTGYEKAVEYVAKAGFDGFDLSMFDMAEYDWNTQTVIDNGSPFRGPDYLKFVRNLKKIGEAGGIVCNQSHAPFPSYIPEIRSYLKRAIECTAEAGAEICVIHPCNDQNAEQNAEMFLELLPFAKEYGVKIAVENMWNWDKDKDCASAAACSSHGDFLKHVEAVNDPYFVACLDIGHAEMRGLDTSAEQMILSLGSHLQALHIHDNDLHHDSHQIPFSMDIDFSRVVAALKQINYSGWFTLEADQYFTANYADGNHAEQGVRELATAARRLADMFDKA